MSQSELDTVRIQGLNELCWHFKYSNPDSAFFYGNKARIESQEIGYDYGIAKAANNMAIVHWGKGSYDSAVSQLDIAEVIYKKINLEKGICAVLVNRGILKQNLGDISGSLDDLFEALRMQEKLNLEAYLGPILTNIGSAYNYNEDYFNAKEWYLKSYRQKISSGSANLYITEMNLGIAYQKLGQIDSALLLYEKSRQGASNAKAYKVLQESALNIGTIHIGNGNPHKALELYKESESLLEISENMFDKTILYNRFSEAMRMVGKYNEAKEYAQKSLIISQELGNFQRIAAAYLELQKITEETGDFRSSLKFNKKHEEYRDSVFVIEKEEKINEVTTKYEVEKKDQEIKILSAERELNSLKLKQSRTWIIAITIASFLILGILLLLSSRRRYKLKAKLANEKEELQKQGFKAVITATEEERKRIAKDLHDGVVQQIAAVKLTLSNVVSKLPKEQADEVSKAKIMAEAAAEETRNLSHQMMPKVLIEVGLIPAMEEVINNHLIANKLRVDFQQHGLKERYENRIEIAVYRIFQELVNNIIKHSNAKNVDIQLMENGGKLLLIVEDDGVGMTKKEGDGIGLSNIKSRLTTIDGKVDYASGERSGTVATIVIPL